MLFYKKLAKYYDKIYHYVDYKKHADFIIKKIDKLNASENNNLLDVACGTGSLIPFLQKAGYIVTGLDINNEMLQVAKRKNPLTSFIKGDMKKLNLNKKFGAIICFFNSILYNKNAEEMKSTLSRFYSHLDIGGILIFDTVDKTVGINSKRDRLVYRGKNEILLFQPQWLYDKDRDRLDLDIEFIINGKKINEHHQMGAFRNDELKELLKKIGFEVFVFVKEKYNLKKKAVIFVCKKGN